MKFYSLSSRIALIFEFAMPGMYNVNRKFAKVREDKRDGTFVVTVSSPSPDGTK